MNNTDLKDFLIDDFQVKWLQHVYLHIAYNSLANILNNH